MRDRHRSGGLLGLILICVAALTAPSAGQIGSRPAEDWIRTLERPERVAGLRIPDILPRLGLAPGHVVADIGAGPGVFTLPFAKSVSPGGRVYAVEIDQALLDHIARKAKTEGLANVQTVLGKFADPNLPAADVDLAFFHDVLHHIEDRPGYLKALARYIKPGGRVAIIERAEGRGDEMHIRKDQVTAWMAEAGFTRAQDVDLFPDKWFVVYSR